VTRSRLTFDLSSFSPASLFTRLSFSDEEMRTAMENGKPSPDRYYIHATLFHEWIHQLQILATSFGREVIELLICSGLAIGKSLKQYIIAGQYSRLRRPLLLNMYLDKELRKSLGETGTIGLYAGILVRYFLGGYDCKKLPDNPFPKAFSGRLELPKTTPCPLIKYQRTTIPLGAYHILEGFAFLQQRLFVYLKFGEKIYRRLKRELTVEKDPYRVLEDYVYSKVGPDSVNFVLIGILADIALNGQFRSSDPDEKHSWEDVHPGWRLVQSIDFLANNKYLIRDVSLKNANEVKNVISENFRWNSPWEDDIVLNHLFRAYIPEALEVRTKYPLALICIPEYFDKLVEYFPYGLGFSNSPKSLDECTVQIAHENLTPEEKYELHLRIAMIAENVLEILFAHDEIICPIHGTRLSKGVHCKPDCDFIRMFRIIFGIEPDEYFNIPVVTEGDLERFSAE
jgi:hypothetical protein